MAFRRSKVWVCHQKIGSPGPEPDSQPLYLVLADQLALVP